MCITICACVTHSILLDVRERRLVHRVVAGAVALRGAGSFIVVNYIRESINKID